MELAARYGDPLFSANVTNPIEPYAELVRLYRERWAAHGHDPAEALVGAGTAGFSVARASQEAYDAFRPAFAQRQAMAERFGLPVVFPTFEDFVERSSALVGSPQQVIDKVLRYHEALGHEAIHLHSDGDGQTPAAHRAALELFQTDVAPVLRAAIPSRPLAGPIPFLGPPSTPVAEPVGAR